jgi:teichuronic acid biosynthesis glycosyltransferase TuaH
VTPSSTSAVADAQHAPHPFHSVGRPDIVLSLRNVTWRAIHERDAGWAIDNLTRRVTSDARLGRVLVVDPFRSAAVVAKRALTRSPEPAWKTAGDRISVCTPLRVRRRERKSPNGVRRSYEAWDRRAARAARSAGLRRPHLITADPFVAGYAPLAWTSGVTYYATDDFSAYPPLAPWKGAIDDAHRRIAAKEVPVCAVSDVLLRRISPCGPGVCIPNGIRPEPWRSPGPPPSALAGLPRPWLLYVGTLDGRVDLDLVRMLSAQFESATLIFAGPVRDRELVAALDDCPNSLRLPPIRQPELAGLVAAADVGLVPHVRTSLTEAMSPLKVYDYLAGGLPVAAVDLEPMQGISPRVRLAASDDGFARVVSDALRMGRATESDRQRTIEEISWDGRHSRLLEFALGKTYAPEVEVPGGR